MKWSLLFGCAALAALVPTLAQAAPPVARVSQAELAALKDAAVGEFVLLSHAPLDKSLVGAVRVKRIDVYAPGARVLVAGAGGLREIPRSTLRNFIADPRDPEAPLLAFSLADDGKSASGVLMTPDGSFAVDGIAGNGLELKLGERTDRTAGGKELSMQCGADAVPATDPLGFPIAPARAAEIVAPAPDGAPATRVAVIAVDTDNELLQLKFADNTVNATNYIAALFTQMNLIYERDLDVVLQVGTTILRPSTTPDPYTVLAFPANQAILTEFGNWWQANQAATPRVLAMMLSGKSTNDFSSSGIAWVLSGAGTIYCNARSGTGGGYSFSEVFKFGGSTAANDTQVVAHELGHNFGASHTHCTNAAGVAPSSIGTLDQCYFLEAGSGCYSGPKVCPSAAGRTLMSYCHLPNGPPPETACGGVTLAFHPVQITTLSARILTNFPACITPAAAGEAPMFLNGFE